MQPNCDASGRCRELGRDCLTGCLASHLHIGYRRAFPGCKPHLEHWRGISEGARRRRHHQRHRRAQPPGPFYFAAYSQLGLHVAPRGADSRQVAVLSPAVYGLVRVGQSRSCGRPASNPYSLNPSQGARTNQSLQSLINPYNPYSLNALSHTGSSVSYTHLTLPTICSV